MNASERAATRTRRRRLMFAAALVVLLIASITATGLAVTAASSASRQRDLLASGQLAEESQAFAGVDPVLESLLAAAAQRVAHTPQAQASMLYAYAQPERAILQVSGAFGGDFAFVADVAISPDGKILATAGGDGLARLWDLATHQQVGKPMMATSPFVPVPIADAPFTGNWAVTFSPNGRILATAAGQVQLWDVATHRKIGPAFASGSSPDEAAFSPDGTILATAGSDGTVRLWDVATRGQIGSPMIVSDSSLGVSDVAFSHDGQVLATAAFGGKIQLWDVKTQRQIGTALTPGDGDPTVALRLAFSPDGQVLAAGSSVLTEGRYANETPPNGTAQLWDVATRRQIGASIDIPGGGDAVAFSRDGKILATGNGDGTARFWDVRTQQQVGSLNAGAAVGAIAFSPDGQSLATADDDGTARVWDVGIYGRMGSAMVAYTPGLPSVNDVIVTAFSPDSRHLATADDDGTARVWDVATQHQVCQLVAGNTAQGADAVAFSPDGKALATAGGDGIRFWDVATCGQAGPLVTKEPGAYALAFSPDGKTLVAAGNDGTILFWNVVTRRGVISPIKAPRDTSFQAVDLAFSPDGKTLATAGNDGTARLWDVAAHDQIGQPIQAAQAPNSLRAVAFSPDGKTLATAGDDGLARLWDVTTRLQIGPPMAASGPITSIAFSPDGQFLATGDASTARLWDVATQQQIGPSMTQAGGVNAVALSPDGNLLATGGQDGTVELWNVAFPGDLLDAMCSIAGRSLTRQEWASYSPSVPYRAVCP